MNVKVQINVKKIRFITVGILILFSMVVIFLIRWQIVEASRFEDMATERIRNITIPALRGSIYSSDEAALAYQERRFDVFVYIPELQRSENAGRQTRQEFINKVSDHLEVEEEDFRKKINSGSWWIKIADKLTQEEKDALLGIPQDSLDERSLEGMFVEYTSDRVYPSGQLASHILGFYGNNGTGNYEGRSGIELYWEGSLQAIEGYKLEQVDSNENTIAILDITQSSVEEQEGVDLVLTIDTRLQKVLEEALEENVEAYKAEAGASVLMDPETGAILAAANFPTYDPNEYEKVEEQQAFSNRAFDVPYEYGSIGKIFTAAAAIEEEAVTPSTVVLPNGHDGCEFYREPDHPDCSVNIDFCRVCTYDRSPQGEMNVAEGLVRSDNIAFYETAKTIGKETLHEYLKRFRISESTGVEIFESNGLLTDWKNWTESDLVTHSYGHGSTGTLLQITSAVSALANDGKIMQPYLVEHIVDPDGKVRSMVPKVIGNPISEKTADEVSDILREVYFNSVFEVYNQDLREYDVAMKSGTALIPENGVYTNEINTTYVAWDTSNDKSFILATWLHKPQEGTISSQNARYLWIDTFRGIKDLMNVPTKGE